MCQGDLELSIREASEVALPTLPSRDWLRQVSAGSVVVLAIAVGVFIGRNTAAILPNSFGILFG